MRFSIMETMQLYYRIFFYNHFNSSMTVAEAAFEPLFRFIERFARSLGRIFVVLVVILTSMVVVIYETCIFPWNHERWTTTTSIAVFILGHYILLNIVYNYYKAVLTPPGKPPARVENPVSICRNCISPKPPRTHHCSVCKTCILKMDHHCPWLNNCVGHLNHRYFLLFCVFMTSGTIFISLTAYSQFILYFMDSDIARSMSRIFSMTPIGSFIVDHNITDSSLLMSVAEGGAPLHSKVRFFVLLEFFLCIGVTFALGGLTIWHGYLISNGETSIEKHINIKERRRMAELGSAYRNPYNFGVYENWKVFFGIEAGTNRSWLRVLFPSSHSPTGDGNVWRTINSKSD